MPEEKTVPSLPQSNALDIGSEVAWEPGTLRRPAR